MDLQRALGDLAEVRDRLAHVQRFEGYSAPAAAASGVCAIFAGVLQLRHAPAPHSAGDFHAYLAIWLTCLAVSLALNYGAAAAWLFVRLRGRAQRLHDAATAPADRITVWLAGCSGSPGRLARPGMRGAGGG